MRYAVAVVIGREITSVPVWGVSLDHAEKMVEMLVKLNEHTDATVAILPHPLPAGLGRFLEEPVEAESVAE